MVDQSPHLLPCPTIPCPLPFVHSWTFLRVMSVWTENAPRHSPSLTFSFLLLQELKAHQSPPRRRWSFPSQSKRIPLGKISLWSLENVKHWLDCKKAMALVKLCSDSCLQSIWNIWWLPSPPLVTCLNLNFLGSKQKQINHLSQISVNITMMCSG